MDLTGITPTTRRVRLLESLVWIDLRFGVHRVPSGFSSDGASLPEHVWWLLGGKLSLDFVKAALLHDYYCTVRSPLVSSRLAAALFRRGLRADGMSAWRASACYYGVRWFGPTW